MSPGNLSPDGDATDAERVRWIASESHSGDSEAAEDHAHDLTDDVPPWLEDDHDGDVEWTEQVHYSCVACTTPCINHCESDPAKMMLCRDCLAGRIGQKFREIAAQTDDFDGLVSAIRRKQ